MKIERWNKFVEVLLQIHKISNAFQGDTEINLYKVVLDDIDFSEFDLLWVLFE